MKKDATKKDMKKNTTAKAAKIEARAEHSAQSAAIKAET